MKLILIPLLLLILVAVTVQMVNLQPVQTTYTGTTSQDTRSNDQITKLGGSTATFNLTVMGGFIALFTAIAIVGILSGLNISVLGSTVQISQRSQSLMFNSLFFGGIWGIFSILATTGINGVGIFSFPFALGALFYLILTLFYVMGINQQVNKSE